jgi:hypothetical protein
MNPDLKESATCEGIYFTDDRRFYAAETEIPLSPRGAHAVVEYMPMNAADPVLRICVNDLAAARAVVAQIAWAEESGRV